MLLKFDGRKIDLKPTKIIGVARNYRAHADEMNASIPEEPKIFLKPPTAMTSHNGVVILPKISKRVDYEVELAVVIKNRTHHILSKDVKQNILGYTIIVDITARDIQAKAKKEGMPWTIAKGFDTFAPLGPKIVPVVAIDDKNINIWLKVNGVYKQQGNTRDMIYTVDDLISFISRVMTLEPMDIIATGTPAGVGPMEDGDIIEAGIEGIGVLKFSAKREK